MGEAYRDKQILDNFELLRFGVFMGNWNTLELVAFAAVAVAIVNARYEPSLFKRMKTKLMPPHSNKTLEEKPVLPVRAGDHVSSLLIRPLVSRIPTVFLDFDGVCHRNFNESFEKLPLIESLLEQHDCQIVISSNWRETCSEEVLKDRVGEVIWSRVVGFTPVLSGQLRDKEVLAFSSYYRLENFIVLDDDKDLFDDNSFVYFVDRRKALMPQDIEALSVWINRCS